jgi:ssDNA-binding Zn-finger/Zn-ribbon topoisomerase 1
MFAAQKAQYHRGTVYERSFVECEKCASPIVVHRPNNVSVEFSVPCPKCGHRGMYFKRMLMAENPANRCG